jgi:hypothetical protein
MYGFTLFVVKESKKLLNQYMLTVTRKTKFDM